MNLISIFRARWKHPDPEVRASAMSSLEDQALLGSIARKDPHASVRRAAFARLTDPEQLAEVAKAGGEFDIQAATRLVDPIRLVDVAREAISARVRAAAVGRINDPHVLQQIVSVEVDLHVRQCAKGQAAFPDAMRDHLKQVLSSLETADFSVEGSDPVVGSLVEICAALSADPRFRIDGIVGETRSGSGLTQFPFDADTVASRMLTAAGRTSISVVASSRVASLGAQSVSFQIRIWRTARDEYRYATEERRLNIVQDALMWSISSSNG